MTARLLAITFITAATILLTIAAIIAIAHPTTTPRPGADTCEQAMRAAFARAIDNPDAPPATRPTECAGLTDDQLASIAAEVISEGTR